ncbi:MAG: LPXTG cell wall anchor domain-containing protein [Candidatus Melainabacteria bacterium]|nr:MAG: LPXTG cell wall anchor domain-containing protein [Candidatus Melainabacteria bacterium]
MKIWALIRPVFYLLIGVGLVYFALTDHPAAENKLKLFEGVPEQVHFTRTRRHDQIAFRLNDMRTDYQDDSPHYTEVQAALQTGQQVKVWVDNEGTKDKYGRFYKMSAGDKEIVSYAETVESKKSSGNFMLWIGLALIGIAGFLFWRRTKG